MDINTNRFVEFFFFLLSLFKKGLRFFFFFFLDLVWSLFLYLYMTVFNDFVIFTYCTQHKLDAMAMTMTRERITILSYFVCYIHMYDICNMYVFVIMYALQL